MTEEALAQCVSEIRRALGEAGRDMLRTVPRRGYVLMPPKLPSEVSLPVHGTVYPGIAVLPFEEFTGGPAGLGFEFAAELIVELARNHDIRVLSRHASFTAASRSMMPFEIGRAFDVNYVLEGNLRTAGEDVIINVQLIDTNDCGHVWAGRFRSGRSKIISEAESLATTIATLTFSEIQKAMRREASQSIRADLGPHQLTRTRLGASRRMGPGRRYRRARQAGTRGFSGLKFRAGRLRNRVRTIVDCSYMECRYVACQKGCLHVLQVVLGFP